MRSSSERLREVFDVEVQDPQDHALNEFIQNEYKTRESILNGMVGNAPFLGRSGFQEVVGANQRNLNRDCGYPGWRSEIPESYTELTIELFQHFYEREPIATRVVEIYPLECWGTSPRVIETEDLDDETPFEKAWKELSRSLSGGSKYKQKKSILWKYLKQVDIDSGIGTYGLLFLGLNDGSRLDQPVDMGRDDLKLIFLRSIPQKHVEVSQYESDDSSERFGHPVIYQVDFVVPDEESGEDKGTGVVNVSANVHWTRVIHVAEGDDVFGTPRQRPVFNRLWDIRKLYGGSAEMYWRGALPGLALEIDPNLTLAAMDKKAKFNETKIREQMQLYGEGLQRWLVLNGIRSKNLSPQVVDPSPQIERQLEAICIIGGYPKRVFMGSERGELSSSQDTEEWNDKVVSRQEEYLTPQLIVRLIDRLIDLKILPEPDEYDIKWPDRESQTEKERADVMGHVVTALAKYIRWDIANIISPVDLLTKFMSIPKEEAELLIDRAKKERKNLDFMSRGLPGAANGKGRGPLSAGGMSEGQPMGAGV